MIHSQWSVWLIALMAGLIVLSSPAQPGSSEPILDDPTDAHFTTSDLLSACKSDFKGKGCSGVLDTMNGLESVMDTFNPGSADYCPPDGDVSHAEIAWLSSHGELKSSRRDVGIASAGKALYPCKGRPEPIFPDDPHLTIRDLLSACQTDFKGTGCAGVLDRMNDMQRFVGAMTAGSKSESARYCPPVDDVAAHAEIAWLSDHDEVKSSRRDKGIYAAGEALYPCK